MTTEQIEPGDGRIVCKIDGARVHSVAVHIKNNHATDWTVDRYKAEFPGEPLLSELAERTIKEQLAKKRAAASAAHPTAAAAPAATEFVTLSFAETFGIPPELAMNSKKTKPLMVSVRQNLNQNDQIMVPPTDPAYVFNLELTKSVLIGMERRKNIYLWGYHGTGKTSVLEQYAARTNWPFMRVNHTIGMEEADVLGQWIVKDGATIFSLGPLPDAMINGWIYCADEYDFAHPAVIAVYQSVLEGKPLVIKNAPPELRVIKPHPNFRFCATGNTNGSGDETGLYQGTQMQNAAAYSRFHITEEVDYLDEKTEIAIIVGQTRVPPAEVQKVVKFANEIRREFKAGKMNAPISTRELISAAEQAAYRGMDWRRGIASAFTNRLSRTDREVANQFAQRVFGGV